MNANTHRVIACIDGSALTPAVCDYAAWIAQRVSAPLKLLHTIDHHPETAVTTDLSGNIGLDTRDHLLEELTDLEQQRSKLRLQQGKLLLQTAKERVIQAGVTDPLTNQRHGSLVEALIELENDIRVLVIGVRGKVHENRPGQIGAKLESIIRSLHKPILVVADAFKAPQRIMIAYDGSDAAEKAVEMVSTSPLFKDLSCHLNLCRKRRCRDGAAVQGCSRQAGSFRLPRTDRTKIAGQTRTRAMRLSGPTGHRPDGDGGLQPYPHS